jgi:hypothetical protein
MEKIEAGLCYGLIVTTALLSSLGAVVGVDNGKIENDYTLSPVGENPILF